VGISATLRPSRGGDDKGSVSDEPFEPEPVKRAWLGASLRDRNGALEVASVGEGSPAQEAGLGGGDEVVALDGFRGDIKARLSRADPGQTVRLSFFRMDELLHREVRLREAPQDTVALAPSPAAGEAELRLRDAWLGGPWP